MNSLKFTRNALRIATILIMFVIVAVATADGFAQSYSALLDWAEAHKLHGWKRDSFPLLVDIFILVGELGLFLIALDGFRLRKSLLAWTDVLLPLSVVTAGWGVSLWFNIHHVKDATTEDKITFAIPPIAAMIGLFIMLRTVHRYMSAIESENADATSEPVTVKAEVTEPEPENKPVKPARVRSWRHPFGKPVPEFIVKPSPFSIPSPEDQSRTALSVPETPELTPPWHPSGTITDEPENAPEPPVSGTEAAFVEAVETLLDAVPEPTPEPVKPAAVASNGGTKHGNGPGHPKWDEGVKIYRESRQGPGKAMSQRDLAAALGMRNRSLAANIIRHVKGENE